MLFQLVDQICNNIDGLSVENALALQGPLQQAAPDVIAQLTKESTDHGNELTKEGALIVAAGVTYACIKHAPTVARLIVSKIKDRGVSSSRRCALAMQLAYLVQPHDMIPDNSPGGYGFLDDTILLRAGLVEYLGILPQQEVAAEAEKQIVGFLISLTPSHVRSALQATISTMSLGAQVIGVLDGFIAEIMLAEIIANPLQYSAPALPQAFVPRPTTSYDRGHWAHGAYFEGNNVIIPGGPSLINGNLFIPD